MPVSIFTSSKLGLLVAAIAALLLAASPNRILSLPITLVPSFNPVYGLNVGPNPRTVAVGDFNEDGLLDLVATNANNPQVNNVAILLGQGNGSFLSPAFFATNNFPTNQPVSVAIADFNEDGHQDLAIANSNNFSFSYLQGNGNGTFQPGVVNQNLAMIVSRTIVAGDFNQDGNQDVALTNQHAHSVTISRGNGNGTFQTPLIQPLSGGFPEGLAAGDLDGDQDLDLVASHLHPGGTLTVLLGTGSGLFAPFPLSDPSGGSLGGVALADINHDGVLDVIAANPSVGHVVTFTGNGNGTFQAAVQTPSPFHPNAVLPVDLTGDGKIDLGAVNNGTHNLSTFTGTGTALFSHAAAFPTQSNNPIALATGDFNRDLRADVVTAELNQGLTVFINSTPYTPLLIRNAVASLQAGGSLNRGQFNSLDAKLRAVTARLAQGQTMPAINQLQAFINEVNALMAAQILSPAQGQPLINAANGLITQLGS